MTQLVNRTEAREKPPAIGKDALSLIEFPIALITSRALPDKETSVTFTDRIYDHVTHEEIERSVKIEAVQRPAKVKPENDYYGLPTPIDDEVILALIQLTKRLGIDKEKENRVVRFSLADVLRILHWSDCGPNRSRLRRSLLRWSKVSFTYENSWWDNRERRWTNTKSFSLINDLNLDQVKNANTGQDVFEFAKSEFRWADVVFQSFKDDSLRTLDLERYFRLKRPLARRMYRFLDKEFHYRGERKYDLQTFFCQRVGLRNEKYHTGELKRIAAKAIEELEQEGFLQPDKERYQRLKRGQWMIRFAAGNNASQELPRSDTASAAENPPSGLVKELIDRGVTASTAAELSAAYSAELIVTKLDVFDWMMENNDKRLSQNPAGYLVASIREDYAAPKGFAPKSERQRKKQDTQQKQRQKDEERIARRRQEEHEAATRKAERAHIDAYLKSLTPQERQALEQHAYANADDKMRAAVKGGGPLGDVARRLLVDREILRVYPLKTPDNQPAS